MKINDKFKLKHKFRFRKSERTFNRLFIGFVAIMLVIVFGVIALLAYIFDVTELIKIYLDGDLGWFVILIWVVSSFVIGITVSYFFGRIIMNPIKKIIKGMGDLAEGIYDTEIEFGRKNLLRELSECYNELAKELKKNDVMSANFINNFSHELKTPLVSISGLISLMKQPNFPESKRKEYLDIIDEEANRLATITTNILNLSKLENQSILTDREIYNLSEQIRSCVLLLQKEWEKKNIEINLDINEHFINANVDLMKQVWVNLLDNAIKFSYDNTEILINVIESEENITIHIINSGDTIDEKDINKIFEKFYQVSKSYKIRGNGLGLSIVYKIIDLHDGSISVESKDNVTKFIIELPR